MIDFHNILSDDPILDQSQLVRALDFLAAKFEEHPSGIPLTKNQAFRRDLVAEAIRQIKWPDWTDAEIYHGYMPIKIADEHHFEPFRDLHHMLYGLRLLRHYKGKLLMSKSGKALFSDRFKRFDQMAKHLLFDDPYLVEIRQRRGLFGNWDVWLNVMDIETTHGASGRQITEVFYGAEDEPNEFDPRTSALYEGVLKPLMYCGLLEENRDSRRKLVDRVYRKTPLWTRYLKLDEKPPMLRVVH